MSEKVKKPKANPGPLGLLGFGMTTILLNLHNAGITELSVVIVAMGFAVGGAAQIIAGIFEMKQGNTFGGTAFIAYGFFWWSLIFIWTNPVADSILAADELSMGFYLLLWGVFSLFMFIGTLKHNRITQIVFLSLTALFLLLAIADFSGVHVVKTIAGIVGIFCGASAIYSATGQVVNGEFGRTVMPLG
ncbi:acetate uptake transporter [Christensenellaceae bacterium OttesenSCG-928-K19]|nr:acetate uptake transporter [Christensenellaceae bacterium OttesenSCG-928-K19]